MFKGWKYLFIFLIPCFAWFSLHQSGILSFYLVFFAFGILPLLELFFPPDPRSLSKAEEEILKNDVFYDILLYSIVPIHWFFVIYFLIRIQDPGLDTVQICGYISSMGLLNGVFGINVAHELGHRVKPYERFLAKLLLLSSLYMHFYIEHNRGHHKNVSTKHDPASSRKNEWLYAFWFRSVINAYLSAWKIENRRLKNQNLPVFSWKNEMIRFQVIQVLFLLAILIFTDFVVLFYYVCSAIIGILLLETVNYIEHYGLERKEIKPDVYERVMPHHSWNSNHLLGRIFLFELSRHSDHHYKASRKYQILSHFDQSPQMPTGYPGMMLLSLIPPLWFRVMNKKVEQFQSVSAAQ